jgi:AcrR family transcriptional regulator
MKTSLDTRLRLLEAARTCLLDQGFARLSTRRVAEHAGAPLSQIHYHFGGKQGLVLALLARENERLVARQRRMYGADEPLWRRYEQACEFFDDDLASGYVRVLQEMIAAGWSDGEVAQTIVRLLDGWFEVLTEVAGEAERRFGTLGPFSPRELAMLIGLSFLGGEQLMLLGDERRAAEVRASLRRVGELIRQLEQRPTTSGS